MQYSSFLDTYFVWFPLILLTAEDIDGDSCIQLLRKSDDDRTFEKLGLLTFGKVCKFRKLTESLLPCHSRSSTPSSQLSLSSMSSPKPKLSEISTFSKDIQLLYKAK